MNKTFRVRDGYWFKRMDFLKIETVKKKKMLNRFVVI